ncbi:MAG: TonB-dependent receptor [Gammaproteobacteria bacterium]
MQCCKNTSISASAWPVSAVAVVVTMLMPCTALSADGEQQAPRPMEELIVTGTPSGSEIRKLDASYAITTVSEEDITMFSPKSTADLLKLVPGVWSESSGGVSGANVFVRGFPGGGDAPFLTVQLQGSPIFPPPTLSFLENTTLFRIDETVERVEALRGGPNPVFSNGQPGLTTNFILKEGGEETEGLVKYTTSDYDLQRFDAVMSGPLSEDLHYMIGGYISSSPGIRDAGFNAAQGHQFTVNVTKDFESGTVNVYHRNTDDHGTWYLPAALNVPGIDGEYTQVGTLNRQREIIFGPNNETRTLDLGDGRGWDGSVTGASLRFDFLDGWEFVDRVNFTTGDADTLGLVPGGGAVNVGDLLADPATDPNAVVTGPLTGSVTGRSIGSSEFIQQFGAWEVRKDIDSFTNDFSIAKSWDQATVTVGYYAASTSVDEVWSLGNAKYQVVERGGEVVSGIACNVAAIDGCPGNFNFDLDATGDIRSNAIYLAGDYSIGDLTFDVGVRFENYDVEYTVDEGLTGQVSFAVDNYDEDEFSWTAAANYAINENMGAFARINMGSKFPSFDDFRDNQGPFEQEGNDLIQDVDQYELGYKFVTDNWSLYATGFYTTVEPSFFVRISGPTPGIPQDNEAIGVEMDASYFSDLGFSVDLNATWQNAEIDGGVNNGNDQQRQPNWQVRITPAYQFDLGPAMVTAYGTFTAVDDRFSDPGNTVTIDGYEKVDLGLIALIDRLEFQLAADNIGDDDGLTEGDPRNPSAPNGRFILPRSVKFSVAYAF